MRRLLCFMILILFSACGSSKQDGKIESKSNDAVKNSAIRDVIHREVVAGENKEDTTRIHVVYKFYEIAELPYMVTVNRLLKDYLGNYWLTEDYDLKGQLNKVYVNAFVASFENEFLEAKKEWTDMNAWELDMDLNVDDSSFKNFVQCNFTTYSFTGGAHGNSNVQYHVVEKTTGKKLKLDEICSNRIELNKRVEKLFRTEYEIPSEQSFEEFGLSFENNQFNVSDNFIFGKNEITFFYNQYEIGPYSAGTFSVSIPLSEIQDIFSLDFSKM